MCVALSCGSASAASLTIFAAASTKNAMDEIAAVWTEQSKTKVNISYAGSSALARQIDQGAPADVFLSANVLWMDFLEENQRIVDETRFDLLGNALVLIRPNDNAADIDLAEPGALKQHLNGDKLAMALVSAVPAGIYGKEALESLGIWNTISPQVAQTDNVRSAMALVALGEAPLGITYASDAAAEPRVQITYRFAQATHTAITYPVAAVAPIKNDKAEDFLGFLKSETALDIFQNHGFTSPRSQ